MPQWDFLNFIASEARQYKAFQLLMQAEATGIITENDIVKGVKARCADGELEIRAGLVVACDGRSSTIRAAAGMKVIETGVPVDVLWFRVPKGPGAGDHSLGHIKKNKLMVTIERSDYYQCAYLIIKGAFDEVKQQGLEAFRQNIVMLAPFLQSHIDTVNNWDDVKLLSVQINHLEQWHRPGLICIGDAAHAMSPVGGVGINLAVQDAVAAANILAPAFAKNDVGATTLQAIQARREKPARWIQNIQAFIHNNLFNPQMMNDAGKKMRLPLWIFRHLPWLRRIPGRIVGMGFRPEHIQTAPPNLPKGEA
jgi:2-polyprenyl-6-methoxyphenol hydroxylase-like FAD-dependent oxidoreductase